MTEDGITQHIIDSLAGGHFEVADFTALDRLMPHPMYAKMYWVSVINPSAKTFATVKLLLAEARSLATERDKSS